MPIRGTHNLHGNARIRFALHVAQRWLQLSKKTSNLLFEIITIMDKGLIINKIKESKELLKKDFSITKIGLFGSYSTGSSNEDSDIDLIYELEEGKRLGLKDVYQLETFIKGLLNIDKVDLVNQKYVNPIIEDEIKRTVIYV